MPSDPAPDYAMAALIAAYTLLAAVFALVVAAALHLASQRWRRRRERKALDRRLAVLEGQRRASGRIGR